jgi:hypothetical protein
VALSACKKAPPPPPEPLAPAPVPASERPPQKIVEIEPNDFQRAQAVPERCVIEGTFELERRRVPDDDWYRVAPGPGRTLSLRIEMNLSPPDGGSAEAALEVLDRDRNRLLRTRVLAGQPALVPAVICAEACFVRASSADRASYTLGILGAAPRPDHELEPNDRLIDATPLQPGARMQGTYGSSEDEDWYRIEVKDPKPGQFLRVELSGVAGVRAEMDVRELDGVLIETVRGASVGEGISIRDLALVRETEVLDAGTDGGIDGGVAAFDGGTAEADGGVEMDGGAAEVDGGAVDAGAGALVADAGAAMGTVVPADAGGAMGAKVPADAGSPDAGVAAAPPAHGFAFVVRSGPYPGPRGRIRGADPRLPYTLFATLESGPDDLEIEPNDDAAHATSMGSGTRSGYLAPAGDVDFYRIRTDQPMILRAEVSGLERADVEMQVLAAGRPGGKPALLARANEGGVREGEVIPALWIPAGDTYIAILGAARPLEGKMVRDAEDRDHLYKLTAALSPDDGTWEREPNDDPVRAPEVALPAAVKGYLWPRRDVDCFRFHLPAGAGTLTTRVFATRGMDLQLRLWEIHGKRADVIGTADAVRGEGEEAMVAVPVREGDYAVEVSSPRNKDASPSEQYEVQIRLDGPGLPQ